MKKSTAASSGSLASPASATSAIHLRSLERGRLSRKEDSDRESKGFVRLLRFRGRCKCGMMLTDRDKNRGSDSYACPKCGKSGKLIPSKPSEQEPKSPVAGT